MNLTELLKSEIEDVYTAADGLMGMVDADRLDWKPESGDNWMTTRQLLKHMTGACGDLCRRFVTGQWDIPDPSTAKDEEMLPPAERLPTVESVDEARKLLAEDKKVALAAVDDAGEEALASRSVPVPWFPGMEQPLAKMLLQMVWHLAQHKGQLFYYLKLQGQPVNTMHLYGGGGGGE